MNDGKGEVGACVLRLVVLCTLVFRCSFFANAYMASGRELKLRVLFRELVLSQKIMTSGEKFWGGGKEEFST